MDRILEQKVTWSFSDLPLGDWAQRIEKTYGLPVVLHKRGLEAAGFGPKMPLTVQLQGLSLRAAIQVVLKDLDLAMVRDDGFLLITSHDEKETRLKVRVYPVSDLARTRSAYGRGRWEYDVQPLTDTIQNVTGRPRPGWQDDGGAGTVEFDPGSGSLVIATVDEVHADIESLLKGLRQSRRAQGIPSTR